MNKPVEIMSATEFLAWSPPDDRLWQLVDGEPCAMAPANRTHGAMQAELARLLVNHFLEIGSPCNVVVTPGVIPNAKANMNVRIPDLGITCSPYEVEESTLKEPVLLIEILSPSNQAETWTGVWAYTTIPTVREILVLQSASIGARILRRRLDGTWPDQADLLEDGDLVLESIGFRTPLASLYRTTRLAAR